MISIHRLESVIERINSGEGAAALNGLTPTAKGLIVSGLVRKANRPVVILADKAARAEEFAATLSFFMPDGAGEPPVIFFPPWEILPYEQMSPHTDVSCARLAALSRLLDAPGRFALVTTVEAAARRIPPPPALKASLLKIKKGESLKLDRVAERLVSSGYVRTAVAEEKGEFSVRGGILDVFSGDRDLPARIELFGDEVESIRLYDPQTQRSLEHIDSVAFPPFREIFYGRDGRDAALERLRSSWDELGIPESRREAVEESVGNGVFFNGVEALMPAFYTESATLFDYLPSAAAFVVDERDDVDKHVDTFYSILEEEKAEAVKRGDIAPAPELLFLPRDELEKRVNEREILRLGELAMAGAEEELLISSQSAPRYKGNIEEFIGDLKEKFSTGYSVLLVASSNVGAQRLERILRENDLGAASLNGEGIRRIVDHLLDPQPSLFEENLFITVGKLPSGFVIPQDKWAVLTDDEILGKTPRQKHRVKAYHKTFSAGIEDIKSGDLVAHGVHGIGRYIRNTEMTIGDASGEYLEIEYADNQKLFLPMHGIHLIKKYSGSGGARPALDKMGGTTWKKTRARVRKSIMDMAGKLLKIHASRELAEGHSYSPDSAFHREFADMFEFEETEGQLESCADITLDMESSRPMDRLICGDVGYGKTEVAMRAAFKAVYDGKQVAVLAPTTLLVEQHYRTFTERFGSFPVRIEHLSRFRSRKEQREILAASSSGEVGILIGTHRLLQKDVIFKNLGLVIIDEEQRFGVAHKEKLRSLSLGVDLLTLTATPIPRTLHTAMMGIRDLSVIETPPPNRQSIKTVIAKFSDNVIREAVMRELDRGGQVFFVHNKVHSIHSMARHLEKIVPEGSVAVAHGQMAERELERVMGDFISGKANILVCTTIIESGLDIPAANTIIINRADHFGLAQLYQLRGRVGRDRHRAYSYFLIPGLNTITEVARKRLKAIEELSELGSGFRLAAKDMEIRGAGNLLGPEQSGHVDAVGFDTYCEMLEDAIREIKGEPAPERFEVNVNLSLNGRITPEYVPDLSQRMELYNRLSSMGAAEELDDIEAEMKDRFGPIPEETGKLLAMARIRVLCKMLKIEKVDMIRDRLILMFDPSTSLQPDKLVTAAYELGRKFRFTSETGAEYVVTGAGWKERYASIRRFLEFLLERVS